MIFDVEVAACIDQADHFHTIGNKECVGAAVVVVACHDVQLGCGFASDIVIDHPVITGGEIRDGGLIALVIHPDACLKDIIAQTACYGVVLAKDHGIIASTGIDGVALIVGVIANVILQRADDFFLG